MIRQKISEQEGMIKLGAVLALLAGLWMAWLYGSFYVPIEVAFIANSVVFISWVVKFFINWELCFFATEKNGYKVLLHIMHNVVSICSIWTFIVYTNYINFSGPGFLYIGVGLQVSFLVVGAYLVFHDKTFNLLKAAAYVGTFLGLAFLIHSGICMASLWNAKVVEEKAFVVDRLREVDVRKSWKNRYEVIVRDEDGREENYEVRYRTYKKFKENDEITIKIYQGKTKYVFSSLEKVWLK